MSEKTKARRNAPRKQRRVPREIEAMINRDTRRQQRELAERYAGRPIYPDPESDERYRP